MPWKYWLWGFQTLLSGADSLPPLHLPLLCLADEDDYAFVRVVIVNMEDVVCTESHCTADLFPHEDLECSQMQTLKRYDQARSRRNICLLSSGTSGHGP